MAPMVPAAMPMSTLSSNNRLLGLPAPLGVEKIEREPMPLENTGTLADLGNRGRPVAPLPDG